jgi:hypothetical protein
MVMIKMDTHTNMINIQYGRFTQKFFFRVGSFKYFPTFILKKAFSEDHFVLQNSTKMIEKFKYCDGQRVTDTYPKQGIQLVNF